MPSLTLFFGPDFADEVWAERAYTLDPDTAANGAPVPTEWVLGRSPTAQITLNDRHISVRHAVISYHPGPDMWSVADLGSTNGVRVNRRRLEKNDPYPLAIGDRLWLGPLLITLIEDEGDTIGSDIDDSSPDTIASTEPIVMHPPPAPPILSEPQPAPASDFQAALKWVQSFPLWVQLVILFAAAILLSLWILP